MNKNFVLTFCVNANDIFQNSCLYVKKKEIRFSLIYFDPCPAFFNICAFEDPDPALSKQGSYFGYKMKCLQKF